jgi:hypothetical protein
MFQQRHFEAIAAMLQRTHEIAEACDECGTPLGQQRVIEQALADLFRDGNSRFDRNRFLRACVPGANVRVRKVV